MKAITRDLKVLSAAVFLKSQDGQVTDKQHEWWGIKDVGKSTTQACMFTYVWFFEERLDVMCGCF